MTTIDLKHNDASTPSFTVAAGDEDGYLIVSPNSASPNYNSFGWLRAAQPSYVFDAQMTYDLQPLLFEQITAETGATVTHSATNRNAVMTFASTPTGAYGHPAECTALNGQLTVNQGPFSG